MQNDQAGSSFNKDEFLRTTPPLIAAAKRRRRPRGLRLRHPLPVARRGPRHDPPRHEGPGRQPIPSELGPRRTRGSFGWQLIEPFKPEDDDVLIEKHRPTIFLGTEFEQLLGNWNRDTVVVVGCRTDAGVEGSVRDGYYRGYSMIVVRDCVGTNRENAHHDALRSAWNVSPTWWIPGELLDIWDAPGDRLRLSPCREAP